MMPGVDEADDDDDDYDGDGDGVAAATHHSLCCWGQRLLQSSVGGW